jgi:hypothetical protein
MDPNVHTEPAENHRTASAQDANISRRRRSLPGRSTSVPRQRSNHPPLPPPLPPASPEVISSLISSLSSISTPAQTHFDSLPHIGSHIGSYTAPSSPNFSQSEFAQPKSRQSRTSDHGFGMDYGAYNTPGESLDNSFLHPDDAAIAPIVRMAPAPAPSSPRSPRSPRHKSSFGQDSSPSRGSHASSRVAYDELSASGFGIISAEPGPRLSRAASVASSSSGGRKSLKGQLGLLRRASREFSQEKEPDPIKKPLNQEESSTLKVAHSRASLRSRHSMADVVEEGSNPGAAQTSTGEVSPDVPQASPHQSPDLSVRSPGGIGSGRFIPTRESSLRHSFNNNSNKKRRSARHSQYSSTGSKDFNVEVDIAEAKTETEQTARRIQQVKEQQRRIKIEMEKAHEASALPKHSRPESRPAFPRSSTEPVPSRRSRDIAAVSEDIVEDANDPREESAPSPAVQTRRVRDKKRLSSEKTDSPTSPVGAKLHKRTPSGPLSPSRPSIAEERPSSADSIDLAVEAYVDSPRLTQKIPHPRSGRMIAFSEVGDLKGHVVFCCLGMGLTRYLMAFYDELARTLKLRLITLDRPGVGESDPCLDGSGTPLTWPGRLSISVRSDS